MKNILVVFLAVAMLVFAGISFAVTGNVEKGKEKVATCAGCHGADGNGLTGAPLNPRLAGQVPGYISAQLKAFKNATRKDPVMQGMVAGLSEEDMNDIDAYYSSLPAGEVGIDKKDEEAARKGEKIYRGGYRKYNISACMSCHGPSGEGIPVQYPSLSGQNAEYTEKQLHAFKDGSRVHYMMNPIAFLLSNDQIKQLSLYTQGLK